MQKTGDAERGKPLEQQLRFTAYTQAVSRFRWFILTTSLISVLLALHASLDVYSFQKQQMKGVYTLSTTRFRDRLTRVLEDGLQKGERPDSILAAARAVVTDGNRWIRQHNDWLQRQGCTTDTLEQFTTMRQLSETYLTMKRTDNTIQRFLRHEPRGLPIIGMSVDGNDYMLVLAVMLVFLYVGVYVNIAVISQLLTEFDPASVYANVAGSYFILSGGGKWNSRLRYGALLLPPIALVATAFLDMVPAFNSSRWLYFGTTKMLFARAGIYALCVFVMGLFAIPAMTMLGRCHQALLLPPTTKP